MKLGFLPKRQLLPEQYLKLSPGSEQTWLTDPFKKERSRTVVHELAKNVLTAGFNPDLIVGDDASGHLPTLVIGSILRERARITNATMPVIRFMSGEVARNAHLDKSFSGHKDPATLIITEYIFSGKAIGNILGSLRHNGFKIDPTRTKVATVSCEVNSTGDGIFAKNVMLNNRGLLVGSLGSQPDFFGWKKSPRWSEKYIGCDTSGKTALPSLTQPITPAMMAARMDSARLARDIAVSSSEIFSNSIKTYLQHMLTTEEEYSSLINTGR